MSTFQTNFGMGKTGSRITDARLIIDNLENELARLELSNDPFVLASRTIAKNYLTRLLRKANEDFLRASALNKD